MKKFIYFVIIIFLNHTAFAIELHDALAKAYSHNAKLQLARVGFVDEIEEFSKAFSAFLPTISYNANSSLNNTKIVSENIPAQKTRRQQGSLSIIQPLFNGGKDMAQLKAAQLSFYASRAHYYAKEQDAIYDLIKLYLDCYEAKEKYDISSVSVKAYKQQLEVAEEKLKLGEATLGELARAKAKLAQVEATKLTEYAQLQQVHANFVKEFGIEVENIKIPLLPDDIPGSLEHFLQKAIKVNPHIEMRKHMLQRTKAIELSSKAALLPTVSLEINNGRDFNPEGVNKRTITSLISMRVPIYSAGTEYSGMRKAKHQTRQAVIQLDDIIKSVRAFAISKWEEFESAKSKIIFTTQSVEAAQIAYDAAVQEEILGSKTLSEVFLAEEELSKNKIQKVEAHKMAILTAYSIKSLIGELTAKSLKLKVKYFTPEDEFNSMKKKLFIGS